MELSTGLQKLILEELAQKGLQVKPFSTDPTGGKGYNCSAFARSDEPVTLTIGDAEGQFRTSINVNVNFHRVKAAAPKAAALNTLTTARIGALVDKLKAGK